MCEFRTLDTAVGELEHYMESFNTTKISVQQPDNVSTLVITLAVVAANFFAHVAVSDVPAQLGLKAMALAWLPAALAFKIFRPGQSHQ